MKKLNIYKPYIKGFEKYNTVCFYENIGGYWAWQEPELMEKIKAFEEKHNCLVYAVTHEYTEFGECYDFLYISDYEEKSLIFFVRTKEQPDVPFVTIEYSPKQKRILQCYGEHDRNPTEEVMNFVHKKWLPYANRKLK